MPGLSSKCIPGFVIFLHLCGVGSGLRGLRLWAPEAVRAGTTVKLTCDYDLEDAALYSIKWYRDDQEFYRYVPKESPPTRVFPLPGIQVDISQSDSHIITLLDVQKQLTGFYKCEVSADAPLFHTEIKSSYMTVVDMPAEKPKLSIEKRRYAAGERIRANCTSSASYPAANITWYINGHPLPGTSPNVSLLEDEGGLETAWSSLELEVDGAMFQDSKLRLRCFASLFTVYRRSSEEIELHEDAPQLASVLGSSLSEANLERRGSITILVNLCALLIAVTR
ncbi:cell adhesion molecule 2 [Anabrus simplex]|uniref:cell adhesion molecule 2 n=1 Tax=Anabrus simplex TaxID=316456 RepID=UPI0035A33C8F